MAKRGPKSNVKKEEVKTNFPTIPIEVNPGVTASASQVKGFDDLVSQKPSIIKIQKVEVEFKILGESNVAYFEIDDEHAKLSNEDKSKLRSSIISVLKSLDGKYIFNKEHADKTLKEINSKLIELNRLESRNKVEERKRNEDKEKLERIPKILRTVFGA